MGLFSTLFWIVCIASAVWVIYDVFTNQKKMTSNMKIVWTVCAIVFSIFTAIAYYFFIKKE